MVEWVFGWRIHIGASRHTEREARDGIRKLGVKPNLMLVVEKKRNDRKSSSKRVAVLIMD